MPTDVFGKSGGFDFFKAVAARALTPKGSTKPKPIGWKGRSDKVNVADSEVLRMSDFNQEIAVTGKDGEVRYRRMTPKQKKVAEHLLKGFSRRQAMIRAGYSSRMVKQLNTRKYNRTALTFVEGMVERLQRKGITTDHLAGKLSEWMEAKKTVSARIPGKKADEQTDDLIYDVPDYETQIKAYDRVERILNPIDRSKNNGYKKKREITFTDWVNEDQIVEEVSEPE